MKPLSTHAALGALVLSLTLAGCLARTTDEPEGEVASSASALSRICGGPRHLRCGRNQVCNPFTADHCLGPKEYGVCAAKPRNQLCPQIFAPVCGCDGKTYPNACEAGVAGVIVASKGSCDGTACEGDFSCGDGSFCKSPTAACGTTGTCQKRPQVCPDIFKPVCGCDGNTYSNECHASGAGVSVQQNGACAPKGPTCGGIAARPCPGAGQCSDDPNDNCDPNQGGADCGGICTCIETQLCIRGDHFDSDPTVCACVPDAKPPFCGGIAGFPCPGAGQCVDDPSDSCDPNQGGADCGGICTCIETQLCIRGDHFDSNPTVCACVPDVTNPCAAVLCLTGTVCVAHADGTASCEPQP